FPIVRSCCESTDFSHDILCFSISAGTFTCVRPAPLTKVGRQPSLTASQVLSGDSRVMHTITRYLETLRSSVDGDELHGLIARTLRRHSRNGPLGPDYLIDLYGQLDAYARDAVSLPSMRIRARLLQQHIAPYISDLKLDSLSDTTRAAPAAETARVHPVVEEITLAPAPAAPATTAAVAPEAAGNTAVEGVLERPGEKEQAAAEERTEKYQQLLRSEKDAWQAIYGTVKDYQHLKDAWLKSLDELSRQRDALEEKLLKTTEQLTKLEVEHDKVRTELQSARGYRRFPACYRAAIAPDRCRSATDSSKAWRRRSSASSAPARRSRSG